MSEKLLFVLFHLAFFLMVVLLGIKNLFELGLTVLIGINFALGIYWRSRDA